MSKRFTDTDKWKDEWYLSLDNDNRAIWQFLLDNCTNAGRWKKNFKLLNFSCNVNINEKTFMGIFSGWVIDCNAYFFIPKFLKFQYPKGLNSDKPAIVAVKNELLQYGLEIIVRELLGNDYLIIKDKDKEKRKEKAYANNNIDILKRHDPKVAKKIHEFVKKMKDVK